MEEADDTRALVLDLVEGPTLADRIDQGPIPVDEALLTHALFSRVDEASSQYDTVTSLLHGILQ